MNLSPLASRHSVLVIALVFVLGSVAAHGQRPPGGSPLLIDFTAFTADGNPVTDLNPADVTIRIGGKARTVTSLVLKKIEPAASAATPAEAAGEITPPFSTNEPIAPTVGRSFLIVVDTESLVAGTETDVKNAIEALVKGLSNTDSVAFSTAPRDTAQVGFGTGLTRVSEAVAALRGQRPASVSSADALCRTSQTLSMLNSMLQPLAGRETPTSVIFIAASLSTPDRQSGSSGTCEVVQDQYQAIADTAAEARANIYVVQGDPGAMGRNNGLESLAGVTGAGQVMRVVADGFAPRVLAEASSYWVATLAGDPSDRPGQAQRLEVRAVREGVTIHARAVAAVSRESAQAQAKSGSASPRDMISTTAAFTDLQLRAVAVVQRGQTDRMNVLVMAEPVDPSVKIKAMRVGYFDQTNKGASLDAPQIASYPITTVLPLGAGQYRIRVAATDESGKSGAVDVTVNTDLAPAGPLKLSGLLLLAAKGDGTNKPQLQFSTEENVIVYVEFYGQPTAGVSFKFEVAKSDTGPAIVTLPATSGGGTNEPDKFRVLTEVPLAKLELGDYVIRALVQMEGQPEGKVFRTFRKVAK